jgi:hypothetical protein
MGTGNLICQLITFNKNEKKFNFYQIAQYTCFGLLISV